MPNFDRNSTSPSIISRRSLIIVGLSGGQKIISFPFTAASLFGGISEAITGFPQLMASNGAEANPSASEGNTTISARLHSNNALSLCLDSLLGFRTVHSSGDTCHIWNSI